MTIDDNIGIDFTITNIVIDDSIIKGVACLVLGLIFLMDYQGWRWWDPLDSRTICLNNMNLTVATNIHQTDVIVVGGTWCLTTLLSGHSGVGTYANTRSWGTIWYGTNCLMSILWDHGGISNLGTSHTIVIPFRC